MADLRTWLEDVNKFGQLMTVDGVYWDLELSTLTEIINERSPQLPLDPIDESARIQCPQHSVIVARRADNAQAGQRR